MKTEKMLRRVASCLPPGEAALAAAKVTPRGAAHEMILGAAGTVVGGTVAPALAGAGGVVGTAAGAGRGSEGRAERAAADLEVGHASQVLLVVTDRSLLAFPINGLGRPGAEPARIGRDRIREVRRGETSLFGQKMTEIVVVTDAGNEVGFGVARVHRRHGDAVIDALG